MASVSTFAAAGRKGLENRLAGSRTRSTRHTDRHSCDAQQIVRRHGELELLVDAAHATKHRLADAPHGLGPAERFIDPLPDDLIQPQASVTRRTHIGCAADTPVLVAARLPLPVGLRVAPTPAPARSESPKADQERSDPLIPPSRSAGPLLSESAAADPFRYDCPTSRQRKHPCQSPSSSPISTSTAAAGRPRASRFRSAVCRSLMSA